MFRSQTFTPGFFSIFALLAVCALASPTAMAGCACMCVDGVGEDVCTGFIQTPTPGGCGDLQCEPIDPPVEDPITTPPDPMPPADEPPADTYEPPVAGVHDCRDRQIWRSDLNKYKVYKVCRKNRRHHEGDEEKHKKSKKSRKSRKQRHDSDADHDRRTRKHRRRHHDEGDDGDGDD